MKNIYDMILANAILRIRKNNPYDWKWGLIVYFSMINAFNLIFILMWLDYFHLFSYHKAFKINIFPDSFPGPQLNYAPTFFIQFMLPCIILNYFLIFYKDRYKKLIKKYPNETEHKFIIFVICSLSLCFISAIVIGILKNIAE